MKKIFSRTVLLSLLIVSFLFAASNVSHGGNIVVKPGRFDHFSVQMPDKIRAGEGFTVRLQAYDAHDNLIVDFGETGKDFKISVSGSASAQPSILKAASFTGGAAGITVTDKKAETITLSIFETSGTVPVLTREIRISPNKLDRFLVQTPQFVIAGNNFDVKIIAKDSFDNSITESEIEGKNIKVTSAGTIGFRVINPPSVFRDGISVLTLMAEKTGDTAVDVHDALSGSKGSSAGFRVMPAALSHFKVYAPKEAAAGDPFEVSVSAFDAFDNLVDNYASYGGGVNISSTGQSKLAPAFIPQAEFRNGQALVKLRYEKAEEITIVATESNKNQQGKSTPVRINPSAPDSFVVTTPDTAVAGQKFKIKVEAYDRFNNLVRNYNLTGNDVYLNATGAGTLAPRVVPASEFADGVASVDVVYDKAESFAISAAMTAKREEKKIEVKEQKEEVRPAEKPVPQVKPKPVEKPKPEKPALSEEKQAQKTVEKPQPAPKEEVKKEEMKKAETPEKKEAAKEKKTRDKLFEIKKVSIIEARNKAMVIINMKTSDATLEFKDERGKVNGEEWIKIHLRPAINKTKKLWKFKSAFVKDIHIEDDKSAAGSVNIKIDTLLKQSTFDINRVKDSLVISISGP